MAGTVGKTLVATGAQADGTTVSNTLVPALSATGFAIGAGNTFQFQSSVATAFSSTYGYRMNQASGTVQITTYMDLAAPASVFAWRRIWKYATTPAVSTALLRFFADTTHTPGLGTVSLTTSNRIQFVEIGTGTPLSVTSTGTALVAGTSYYEQGKLDLNTGTMTIQYFVLGSTTMVFQITGTLGSDMAAASGIQAMRLGINTASSGMGNYDISSDTAIGSGDFLPRTDVSNVPPVANAGSDVTVEPKTLITLSSAGSLDTDGTITSRVWTHISGPGTTALLSSTTAVSPTYTAPLSLAGQVDVWRVTVTDDLGSTDFDEVTITVLRAQWKLRVGGVWSPRVMRKRVGGAWS